MMKFTITIVSTLMSLFPFATNAQVGASNQKSQMQYLGTFEAGQPGAGIYKLYDASDDVICYVLMPDTASRKQVDAKWVYESNALGSISCVRGRIPLQATKVK